MNAAPYPADTRAKGWRFELDYERIRQSDTWALAAPEHRPWLLMLWMLAWEQTPCGSLPDDDTLIAARMDMKPAAYAKAKDTFRRGWVPADDGRLYHAVITERVMEMLEYRAKAAKRKQDYRDRMLAEQASHAGRPEDGTRDTAGTNDTGTGTGTGSREERDTVPSTGPAGVPAVNGHAAVAVAQLDQVEAVITLGLPLLLSAGVPERQARSFLGRLRKFNSDEAVLAAIDRCVKAVAASPVEFLQGCLRTNPGHHNRLKALEASNRDVAASWANKGEILDASI